nr:MAG TPA: hypothetical protein [Microviridae sp.]
MSERIARPDAQIKKKRICRTFCVKNLNIS